MMIGDLVQQLTRIIKDEGSTLIVKLCPVCDCTDGARESFMVNKKRESKEVFLVPTSVLETKQKR